MPVVETRIEVRSSIETVFDLCRSVQVHLVSASETKEELVGAVTRDLLELGDEVTFKATHFGVSQTVTSWITKFDRPRMFRDSMVSGAFRRFDHDHVFTPVGDSTLVEDRFDFDAPWGVLGRLANRLFLTRHMATFLRRRLEKIKAIAESPKWADYLPAASTSPRVACPFCGRLTSERPALSAYPLWDCFCGAMGSGTEMRADLDEVADVLLSTLGIGDRVSEPSTPIGDSGAVSMQHYDIPRSLDRLQDVLDRNGMGMLTCSTKVTGHEVHCIWVRAL